MQSMSEHKKRRGNPNWIKGGPSPNPSGRPRSGLALSEFIRERLSPEQLCDLVMRALADEKIDIERRVSFAFQLAAHGYSKPPAGLDLNVSSSSASSGEDWSKVPLEVRRAELERRRALLAQYAQGDEQGTNEPLVSSGSADCSPTGHHGSASDTATPRLEKDSHE